MLHCRLQLVLNAVCKSCTDIAEQLEQIIQSTIEKLLQQTQHTYNNCNHIHIC